MNAGVYEQYMRKQLQSVRMGGRYKKTKNEGNKKEGRKRDGG